MLGVFLSYIFFFEIREILEYVTINVCTVCMIFRFLFII